MIVEREHILNARERWQPAEPVRDTHAESAEIQRQIDEFLAKGGVIHQCAIGEVRYSYDMVAQKPSNGADFALRYKDVQTGEMMMRTTRFSPKQGPKRKRAA